jgi:hypothetical protein
VYAEEVALGLDLDADGMIGDPLAVASLLP